METVALSPMGHTDGGCFRLIPSNNGCYGQISDAVPGPGWTPELKFRARPIDFWSKHPKSLTNEHGVSAYPSIQYRARVHFGLGTRRSKGLLHARGAAADPGGGHGWLQMGCGSSEVMSQILHTIESEVRSRPSAMEYEMAYRARIAIDRKRFAIKQTQQFERHCDEAREASLQLVDALDRLETADRPFQSRFHGRSEKLLFRFHGRIPHSAA